MLSWCHANVSISWTRNKTTLTRSPNVKGRVSTKGNEMKCLSNSSLSFLILLNYYYYGCCIHTTATGIEYRIFAFLSFFVNLARWMFASDSWKTFSSCFRTACFPLFLVGLLSTDRFFFENKNMSKIPFSFFLIFWAFFFRLQWNWIVLLILNIGV